MTDYKLVSTLEEIVGKEYVRTEEPMKRHTTFKIGGNADYFVTPGEPEEVRQLVCRLHTLGVPFYIIGNGSNLLVSDDGYRGVIIQLGERFSGYEILHGDSGSGVDKAGVVYIRAQAGILLGKLGNEAAGYSLAGFEFAAGIPGTLGGAVMMNAGAYGGEMKDVLKEVTVLDMSGQMDCLSAGALELGYRTSVIAKKNLIVLEAVIALHPGNQQEIRTRMKELAARRREKQPLEFPSAGSTFKRPQGYFAGKLIADAGLKGFTVGGAQVSEKHAGFVINTGNATAADVIELTNAVAGKVQSRQGVALELEVRKLGF